MSEHLLVLELDIDNFYIDVFFPKKYSTLINGIYSVDYKKMIVDKIKVPVLLKGSRITNCDICFKGSEEENVRVSLRPKEVQNEN